MQRNVYIRIDDLTRMLADYMFQEDAPRDMKPVTIMINPKHQGKIGLLVSSNEWQGYVGEQLVDLEIKRFYSV